MATQHIVNILSWIAIKLLWFLKQKYSRLEEVLHLRKLWRKDLGTQQVQNRIEEELRCEDWTLPFSYVFCVYLLFLRRIFKNTGFEEWVLLIRVIIHPFTEVISNVKSSEKEIKTKYLNICKLAIWVFFFLSKLKIKFKSTGLLRIYCSFAGGRELITRRQLFESY